MDEKWIAVSERLPEPSTEAIVYIEGEVTFAKFVESDIPALAHLWLVDGEPFNTDQVTHWMPLPAPPESVQPGETPPILEKS